MIRTQAFLNGLTHEECYIRGWQDHADACEAATDEEGARMASRLSRQLDSLLERVWMIAPYELPDRVVFDGEAR